MKLIVCWLAVMLLAGSSVAQTQDQTTSNLINPNNFTGASVMGPAGGVAPNAIFGGVSGGPGAFVDTSGGGAIWFSWGQSTVAHTIAVNQALANAGVGIAVKGFNYSYQYFNAFENRGTLSANISMTSNTGAVLENYFWSHNNNTGGQWQTNEGTKTFTNPYQIANLGNLTMSFTGQDAFFWAGYYGPVVRNPSLSLTYGVDACTANPLSSPTCPNYATAYFNQQCTISALYNPACPGYATAYFTQQCTANPLYNPACPGYQEAYFAYQCQQDGLYSQQCPNYAEAYAKKNILNTTTTTAVVAESSTSTAKTDPISIATTSTTTSTTSPTSVTSVTSVVSGGTNNATTAVVTSISTQPTASTTTTTSTATTTEAKKTDAEVKSVTSTSATSSGTSTGSAKSRAEAVARQAAREASEARTFEAQTATQGLVVGLMGFVPGFDAYGQARIVDVNAVQMARLYNRPTVDNRQALRRLTGASDRLHTEMVDQQYQLGK